ncbi:energy transducer TonB [candidate division KSB1 bacterium]|nr:energy transducer TonB [candidate division KSB1 bacterium]
MSIEVFENRRLYHRKLLEIGLIVSLALHIAVLQTLKQIQTHTLAIPLLGEGIIIEDVPIVKIERKIIPPKPPTIPIASEDPLLPDDITIDPTVYDVTESLPLPDWNESHGTERWQLPFVPHEVDPSPVGGFGAITKLLTYPELARLAGIEGRVLIAAEIDEASQILQTRIVKSMNFGGMDEAAEKAIRTVKWTPAYQRDQPVKVWIAIPVDFKLDG